MSIDLRLSDAEVNTLVRECDQLRAALTQAEDELSAERERKVDAIKFREHQEVIKDQLRAQLRELREAAVAFMVIAIAVSNCEVLLGCETLKNLIQEVNRTRPEGAAVLTRAGLAQVVRKDDAR